MEVEKKVRRYGRWVGTVNISHAAAASPKAMVPVKIASVPSHLPSPASSLSPFFFFFYCYCCYCCCCFYFLLPLHHPISSTCPSASASSNLQPLSVPSSLLELHSRRLPFEIPRRSGSIPQSSCYGRRIKTDLLPRPGCNWKRNPPKPPARSPRPPHFIPSE